MKSLYLVQRLTYGADLYWRPDPSHSPECVHAPSPSAAARKVGAWRSVHGGKGSIRVRVTPLRDGMSLEMTLTRDYRVGLRTSVDTVEFVD